MMVSCIVHTALQRKLQILQDRATSKRFVPFHGHCCGSASAARLLQCTLLENSNPSCKGIRSLAVAARATATISKKQKRGDVQNGISRCAIDIPREFQPGCGTAVGW